MTLSLYDVTIPVFTRALHTMSGLLDTGRTWADESGLEHDELLQARLYPDMKPLIHHVRLACDTARLTAVRVGGVERLDLPATETGFDDLKARIVRTRAFLEAVPKESMEGKEDNTVVLATPDRELIFSARDYVLRFAIPDFFFHDMTVYALLRHNGVPVREPDFIGGAEVS